MTNHVCLAKTSDMQSCSSYTPPNAALSPPSLLPPLPIHAKIFAPTASPDSASAPHTSSKPHVSSPPVHTASPSRSPQAVSDAQQHVLKKNIKAILEAATVDTVPTMLEKLFEAIDWNVDVKDVKINQRAKRNIIGKILNHGAELCAACGENTAFVELIHHWIHSALGIAGRRDDDLLLEMLKVRLSVGSSVSTRHIDLIDLRSPGGALFSALEYLRRALQHYSRRS
jgi:hypothetical protein